MNTQFKPGDRVAIMYPHSNQRNEPHKFLKDDEPLIIIDTPNYLGTVAVLRESDDYKGRVHVSRLNYIGGTQKLIPDESQGAGRRTRDTPKAQVKYIHFDGSIPFDIDKYNSGDYAAFVKSWPIEKLHPTIDGLFVVKYKGGDYWVVAADKIQLCSKITSYYVNVYPRTLGSFHESREKSEKEKKHDCIGTLRLNQAKGKLISVEIVN